MTTVKWISAIGRRTSMRVLWMMLAGCLPAVLPATGRAAQDGAPRVEEIGNRVYQVDQVRIDLNRREVTVPGVINDVGTLEFLANTRGGFKAYESALELDTDAISFNLGMVLVGLDNTNAVLPRQHFDPNPPEGDPVRLWVEWDDDSGTHRIRGEELIYHAGEERTFPETHWVYTGSVFLPDGSYLAESDGVLIGFAHTPASIIENPLPDGVGNYGAWVLNRTTDLEPGMSVRLIVEVVGQ